MADDTDIAADIEAAFEAVEGAEDEEGTETKDAASADDSATDDVPAAADAGAVPAGDAAGDADKPDAADGGADKQDDAVPGAAEADAGDVKPDVAAADTKDAAPLDWTPELREKWGKLDPEIKSQINKREADVNTMLMEGAGNRKMGEAFNQIASPYIPLMQAEGAQSPLHAVDALFKTVGTLRLGSAQQKATEMARLIGVYGVDVETLDRALTGAGGGDPETAGMEAMLDTKLKPVTDFMRTVSDGTAQAERNRMDKGATDVAEFSKTAEFINDVRPDMADLMDLAAKRGTPLTLQDAYDKACAMNPQVKSVLDKRTADAALMESAADTEKKKAAGASINGAPGTPAAKGDMNLRDQLEDAWDEHAGRV